MRRGTLTLLLFIVLLAACSAYIDWPTNPHWSIGSFTLPHPDVKQGLDLQGGVRVVLVPDPAQHYSQSTIQSEIDPARNLIETRVSTVAWRSTSQTSTCKTAAASMASSLNCRV